MTFVNPCSYNNVNMINSKTDYAGLFWLSIILMMFALLKSISCFIFIWGQFRGSFVLICADKSAGSIKCLVPVWGSLFAFHYSSLMWYMRGGQNESEEFDKYNYDSCRKHLHGNYCWKYKVIESFSTLFLLFVPGRGLEKIIPGWYKLFKVIN